MNVPTYLERFKLYFQIGIAFLCLALLGDWLDDSSTFLKEFANKIWLISYLTVLNYILFEYSIPFIKLTLRRILVTPFLLFFYLVFYSFGFYAWRHIGIKLGVFFPLVTYPSIPKGIESLIPFSIGSIFFFGIIRYTYDYRKLKEMAQQLRIEKQEAELNYLRSQTNPHFLFNTLNNIYSLARDKSDLAPESILRLSKILRFMLYEISGAYIAIEQELKIMSDYIELEKLRYDDSLRINFNYDIEDMKQALPPLLLIPLVENAFKHGVSETRNQPFIDIHISLKDRQLAFFVKNSTETSSEEKGIKEKIGLSNLKRQLELLYEDYNLSFQTDESTFTTILKINLASHV